MKRNNYKTISIISLVISLLCLSFAFAAYTTSLNINGTVTISTNWNIIWDNMQDVEASGYSEAGSLSIIDNDTNVVGSVGTLNAPGDKLIAKWDVHNKGSVNAKTIQINKPNLSCAPTSTNGATKAEATQVCNDLTLTINVEDWGDITTGTDEYALDAGASKLVTLTLEYSSSVTTPLSGKVEVTIKEMPMFEFGQADDSSSPSTKDNDNTDTNNSINYSGYYADINNDGKADGIIYIDLLKGANNNDATVNGQWADDDGNYSYATIESSKTYTISDTNYAGSFGTKPIISIKTGSTGNDRFYVMALEDIDDDSHYWYYNAYELMNDYKTTTSTDFGKGRQNTYTMINKWNEEVYGVKTTSKDYPDVWGIIQNIVKNPVTTNGTTGWFIPSKQELSAFGDFMYNKIEGTKCDTSNYSDFGLSESYWSSSQEKDSGAYVAYFNEGYIGSNNVRSDVFARLAITF